MLCPNPVCKKELAPDAFFCAWCTEYAAVPGSGRRPNLFSRFVALQIDPLIAIAAWLLAVAISVVMFQGAGLLMIILFPGAYFVWAVTLLQRGLTPGKMLLGLQVVEQSTGRIPGFGTMFLREIVGRFLSGAFFGLGYVSALWDKNGQAWHDKLAGTVVLKKHPAATFATSLAPIKPDEHQAVCTAPAEFLPAAPAMVVDGSGPAVAPAQLALQTSPTNSAVCLACGEAVGAESNFCTFCGASCAAPVVQTFAAAAAGVVPVHSALAAESAGPVFSPAPEAALALPDPYRRELGASHEEPEKGG